MFRGLKAKNIKIDKFPTLLELAGLRNDHIKNIKYNQDIIIDLMSFNHLPPLYFCEFPAANENLKFTLKIKRI